MYQLPQVQNRKESSKLITTMRYIVIRAANEPLVMFSQSHRRPLLVTNGAFKTLLRHYAKWGLTHKPVRIHKNWDANTIM